jgi:aspartate-semialdehyde dehydrogenase
MKIAIIGITGMVGGVMLQVLEKSKLKIDELIPVASEKSVGKEIVFKGKTYQVMSLQDAIERKPEIAIFSAGSQTSLDWASRFAEIDCYVVDNSSAWRMNKDIPLVVPEINAETIKPKDHIIANPNCSTIQMVLALAPLHRAYGLKRLVISTYQSVTGSGVAAVRQMQDERICRPNPKKFYPHPIDMNLIPHGGDFTDDGYTTEEIKLVKETHKILGDDSIRITATVVRVPVLGGHSESINAEFQKEYVLAEAVEKMATFPGIVIQDDFENNIYPMPKFAEGKDDVFVGRIRRDDSQENTLNMWVVSDNLRKGAATNAIQIAEYISDKFSIA